jgi:phosphatidylglycerophosphate synthase
MLDSWLSRPGALTDRVLDGIARPLARARVAPDVLTGAALLAGVAAGLLLGLGRGWEGLAVLGLSGLLDAVDGRVARHGPGATPWGGVLDLTADRVVEGAVLLGIVLPRPDLHVPGLVLAVSWYVNLCVFLAVGAATERRGPKIIDYPPGVLERSDGLVFALVAVAAPALAPAATWLYTLLEVVTAAQRLRHGRRVLRAPGESPRRP